MKSNLSKYQLIFHLAKMAAILNFRIFLKNAKHKNPCISKTMLDGALSTRDGTVVPVFRYREHFTEIP